MESGDRPYVVIGVPSGEMVHADFMMALLQTVLHGVKVGIDTGVDNFKSSILPVSRTSLVKNALQRGASHVCFIDSDMNFPAETVERLLSHGQPVVAANCVTKRIPAVPTARKYNPDVLGGDVVYHPTWSQGDPELDQVWRVGTGIMLIDLSIFDTLPKPWFPIVYDEEQDFFRGEDWSFCAALEAAGIPIYIDVPLSFAIKHQGKIDYGMDMVDLPT